MKSAGAVRIEISLVYDQGGPAFESYRTWMYHNEAVPRNEKRAANRSAAARLDAAAG